MAKKIKQRQAFDELREAEPEFDIPELLPDEYVPAIRARFGRTQSDRSSRSSDPLPQIDEDKNVEISMGSSYKGDSQNQVAAEVVEKVADETEKNSRQRIDVALQSLFADLPDDPKARLDAVVALQKAFRREAAKLLLPSFNKILKSPPQSFVEKQILASDLNGALHELGLAARGGGINQPCSIVSKISSGSETGWLKLQTRKSPQKLSGPSTKIEDIDLIDAVREEGFGRRK